MTDPSDSPYMPSENLSPRESILNILLGGFVETGGDTFRARRDLAYFVEHTMVDQRGNPIALKPFHHELIKNLLFERRVLNLLPRSWGKCVSGDSEILLSSNRTKRMVDIEPGDLVLSVNPYTLTPSVSRVVAKEASDPKPLYALRSSGPLGAHTLLASAEHPVLTRTPYGPVFQSIARLIQGTDAIGVLTPGSPALQWDALDGRQQRGYGPTFDIQVEPHRNFVADGIVVSNSVLSCVAYPSWRLGTNRDLRVLVACHTIGQAKLWLAEIENVMLRNQAFIETFGYMVPRPRTLRWTDVEKVVLGRSPGAMHSSLRATGIGSGLLGARADIIIMDDIYGLEESISPTLARRCSEWVWNVLMPVLEPDGQVVVSGSRWGVNDIYAEFIDRWKDLPSGMASWQETAFQPEAKYPDRHRLIELIKRGEVDPLRAKELARQVGIDDPSAEDLWQAVKEKALEDGVGKEHIERARRQGGS